MKRRQFLSAVLGSSARNRGIAYLSKRQNPDGSWTSNTYGLLRSGLSLTPFVLNALLDAGVLKTDARLTKALAFLLPRITEAEGDYPCYANALALRAVVRMNDRNHAVVPKLIDWLRTQQMSPENGWAEPDPAFGAWGIGGQPRRAPHSGHVDLSMTRHVLEALAEAGLRPTDEAMRNAQVFVRRCRNPHGGFFFSTVETGANKAGEDSTGYLAYGTTTADGLICLLATGAPDTAPSLAWLHKHDHPALPPGFVTAARQRYAEGLRYYYADAAVRAFRAAGLRRSVPFAAVLEKAQRPDGSWANPEVLVKEDDPLIATAFAISALS